MEVVNVGTVPKKPPVTPLFTGREVSVGEVIVFPAVEKHWHGATDEQTTQLEE